MVLPTIDRRMKPHQYTWYFSQTQHRLITHQPPKLNDLPISASGATTLNPYTIWLHCWLWEFQNKAQIKGGLGSKCNAHPSLLYWLHHNSRLKVVKLTLAVKSLSPAELLAWTLNSYKVPGCRPIRTNCVHVTTCQHNVPHALHSAAPPCSSWACITEKYIAW